MCSRRNFPTLAGLRDCGQGVHARLAMDGDGWATPSSRKVPHDPFTGTWHQVWKPARAWRGGPCCTDSLRTREPVGQLRGPMHTVKLVRRGVGGLGPSPTKNAGGPVLEWVVAEQFNPRGRSASQKRQSEGRLLKAGPVGQLGYNSGQEYRAG